MLATERRRIVDAEGDAMRFGWFRRRARPLLDRDRQENSERADDERLTAEYTGSFVRTAVGREFGIRRDLGEFDERRR